MTEPNGTISEKTKIPLKLAIPLVAFVIGCASYISSVENRLQQAERNDADCREMLSERKIGDRFRGADADRWFERVQAAWLHYAHAEGLSSYPEVPPWREGTNYAPAVIHIDENH